VDANPLQPVEYWGDHAHMSATPFSQLAPSAIQQRRLAGGVVFLALSTIFTVLFPIGPHWDSARPWFVYFGLVPLGLGIAFGPDLVIVRRLERHDAATASYDTWASAQRSATAASPAQACLTVAFIVFGFAQVTVCTPPWLFGWRDLAYALTLITAIFVLRGAHLIVEWANAKLSALRAWFITFSIWSVLFSAGTVLLNLDKASWQFGWRQWIVSSVVSALATFLSCVNRSKSNSSARRIEPHFDA
jgi:hypothetical protein